VIGDGVGDVIIRDRKADPVGVGGMVPVEVIKGGAIVAGAIGAGGLPPAISAPDVVVTPHLWLN